MKTSIAIVMILCGTVLIAAPLINNAIAMQQVTSTMVALNRTVNLTSDMPKYVNATCMATGVLMVCVGAFAGLKSASK